MTPAKHRQMMLAGPIVPTILTLAVPKPRPYVSAREAFLYFVLFMLLGIVAWNLGSLLFALIDTAVRTDMPAAMADLAPSVAIDHWLRAAFACNQYIDAQAPWTLRKTDPQRMETVLATLYIAIAQLAVAILPVIPASATALLDHMGVPQGNRGYRSIGEHWYSPLAESGFELAAPKPLFPRLELPEADA